MTFTTADVPYLLHILEEKPHLRQQMRLIVLTEELLTTPDRLQQLEGAVVELVEAHKRAEGRLTRAENRLERVENRLERVENRLERVENRLMGVENRLERLETTVAELAEAQKRTEERLQQLEATVRSLSQEVRELVQWSRGKSGRRDGERYERTILRRAPALFSMGQSGGADQSLVQQQLAPYLQETYAARDIPDLQDPFLADLIWWKSDRYAVVEVGVQVDMNDVERAALRAETLRQAGLQAMPMVIGEGWARYDTRDLAAQKGVEWKVGDDISTGYVIFRRLPPA